MRLPNQIERKHEFSLPELPVARGAEHDLAVPRATRVVLALLAAAATGLSAYLAWLSFTGASVAGCDAGGAFDCDHVLATRWSSWLSVPIALPAVAIYGSILAVVAFLSPRVPRGVRRAAWWIVLGLSATAALAAVWFVGLQVLYIGHFCWPCLATHTCGLLLAATAWYAATVGSRRADANVPPRKWIAAAAGALLVAVLVAGQAVYEPPTFRIDRGESHVAVVEAQGSPERADAEPHGDPSTQQRERAAGAASPETPRSAQKPALSRILKLRNTSITLDAYEHPILGSPDAEHVIVKVFDYTCHHCRDQHFQLEETREILGNRLAILVLPTPMNGKCNPFAPPKSDGPTAHACLYARLAVAVWRIDRAKFAEFHHWLFEPETPPPIDDARKKARSLVGEAAIRLFDDGVEPIAQIEQYTKLYGALGSGKIPKLVDERMIIDGRFQSGKQIVEVLEEQWKLPR